MLPRQCCYSGAPLADCPARYGILFMFGRQYRPGTMDKQGPQIGITSLAYPEQDLFTPTGVLAWNQSEPGSQLSAILGVLAQWSPSALACGANTRDLPIRWQRALPIALLNLLVECSDDIEQVRHNCCSRLSCVRNRTGNGLSASSTSSGNRRCSCWIPRGTTMPNSANNPLI
jgi:hypothetical protein